MKKIVLLSVLAMLCMVFTAPTSAQEVHRDPRAIAAAFALSGAETSYNGEFYYYVYETATEQSRWVWGRFEASATADGSFGVIKRLWVSGTEVPLLAPLTRLPHDSRGAVVEYSLFLSGLNSEGKEISSGSMNTKLLEPGDPILVVLRPGYVSQKVLVEVPSGTDAENLGMVLGGDVYHYNQWLGGFYISIDPVAGPQDYYLVDTRTGLVVGSGGTVHARKPSETTPDSMVQIAREGFVEAVNLNNGWWHTSNFRQLDSETLIDGEIQPAKVFYMDCAGEALVVYIYGAQVDGTKVRIDEVMPDGTLRHVETLADVDDYYHINQIVNQPLKKVLVTVYGQLAGSNGFQIGLARRGFVPWQASKG